MKTTPKYKAGEKLRYDVAIHAFYQARNVRSIPATVVEVLGKRHGRYEYVVATPNPFREDRTDEQIVEENYLYR